MLHPQIEQKEAKSPMSICPSLLALLQSFPQRMKENIILYCSVLSLYSASLIIAVNTVTVITIYIL